MNILLVKLAASITIGFVLALIVQKWKKGPLPPLVGLVVAIATLSMLISAERIPTRYVNITIIKPHDGDAVEMRQIVEGETTNHDATVYIFIHPLSTDTFWVQNLPVVGSDGSWKAECYFGTNTQGIDETFEIIALASLDYWFLRWLKPLKLKPGDILKELPPQFYKSSIITVRRTK